MEYSSRNRHCLVDMEYKVDDTCLEDSLMQPADQTPTDTAAETAPPSTADIQGDGTDKSKPSGALGALVKVGTVPQYSSYCLFSCGYRRVIYDFF